MRTQFTGPVYGHLSFVCHFLMLLKSSDEHFYRHLCNLEWEMRFWSLFFLASGTILLLYTPIQERVSFSPHLCQQWVLLTLDICHSNRVILPVVLIWSSVMWFFSLPYQLIPAGALLEGDRKRRRSLRSSERLWPMRKPGSWRRNGKWRWRTARLPKSWRSAFMRNSRWASAWGICMRPPVLAPRPLGLMLIWISPWLLVGLECFMRTQIWSIWAGRNLTHLLGQPTSHCTDVETEGGFRQKRLAKAMCSWGQSQDQN